MSKSFGGIRDGFKSESRGKNFSGKPFIMPNNITNSGQNLPRAGGKFNSTNSHKFDGQVCHGGGPGKFSNHGGNNYYGQSRPTSQFNNFYQDKQRQNKPIIAGMGKNLRGKFNSVVVKNAMSAINNSPPKQEGPTICQGLSICAICGESGGEICQHWGFRRVATWVGEDSS